MVAYFLYPNGTALNSNQVDVMLAEPEHFLELEQLGLLYIVSMGSVLWSFHHLSSTYSVDTLVHIV